MRDPGATYHSAKDGVQPRVGKHPLSEYDKGVVHVVLWHSSGDPVQVSGSQAQWPPGPD